MILKTNTGTLTANEELLDRAIRHASLLERLKASEVRRIVGFLNREVIPDILDLLEKRLERIRLRGIDGDAMRTQRYQDLVAALREVTSGGMAKLRELSVEGLVEIGQHEAKWQIGALAKAAPIELEFQLPSVATLRSIVTSRPFQGHVLNDWYADLGKSTAKKVQAQINLGLAEGQDTAAIVRRLRGTADARYTDGLLQGTRREVEAVVRTAVQHVTTHAREETARENSDLVKGVQWVATLDSRTTPICRSYDGKVFGVDEGPRPPAHFGCRSTTVPVLKSWKELGISLKEAPEGTRASMDGQVPASTTYYDWLKKQSAERQDQVLGPTRGRMLRAGTISVEDLKRLGPTGRPLTLKELARLEAA